MQLKRFKSRSVSRAARAFTLTEMLIAVAVLAVVILATSTIFGTAQRIASLGQANENLLQQAAAIEQRIRQDVTRMSREGFLAIQCVGVRNDINDQDTGRLLDPERRPEEEIRCDQLVFFAEGTTPSARFTQSYANTGSRLGDDLLAPAQATFAMIYYGTGVQMPVAPPGTTGTLFDINRELTDIFPWSSFGVGDVGYLRWPGETIFQPPADVPLVTPDSNDWLLMRQAVLLADDDGGAAQDDPRWFMGRDWTHGPNSAGSLFYFDDDDNFRFDPWIVNSRVDIAAVEAEELRQQVCVPWGEFANSLLDTPLGGVPSELVATGDVLEAMFYGYPRGEAYAPSMDRMDVMLTNSVLSPNVSDFRVEWTWADGVGRDTDSKFSHVRTSSTSVSESNLFEGGLPGVVVDGTYLSDNTARSNATPWFGLSDEAQNIAPASAFTTGNGNPNNWSHYGAPNGSGAVRIGPPVGAEFGNFNSGSYGFDEGTMPLANIEFCDGCAEPPSDPNAPPSVRRYGAVFGFNSTDAIVRKANGEPFRFMPPNDDGRLNAGAPIFGDRVYQDGSNYGVANTYTPWPTALRITFRLHDPNSKITGGRVFQFVIPVPKPHS